MNRHAVARASPAVVPPPTPPPLLERNRLATRSPRRCAADGRHPRLLGTRFHSLPKQALNALLFFYGQVLEIELGGLDAVRARRGQRLPVVLTPEEVRVVYFRSILPRGMSTSIVIVRNSLALPGKPMRNGVSWPSLATRGFLCTGCIALHRSRFFALVALLCTGRNRPELVRRGGEYTCEQRNRTPSEG